MQCASLADETPAVTIHGYDVYPPRSFSYLLCRKACDLARARQAATVLDVGCGSGVVAIALGRTLPHAQVFASDISPHAVAATRINAARNGVVVQARTANLLDGIADNCFDLIVSHPPAVPYPPGGTWGFSPGMTLATNGGIDGSSIACRIARNSARCLKPDGTLLLLIPHWCARRHVLAQLAATFESVQTLESEAAVFFPLLEGAPDPATLENLRDLIARDEIEVIEGRVPMSHASVIKAEGPRDRLPKR